MNVHGDDRIAAAIFAAISADNPTAPTPNTAKLSPGCGFMTLSTRGAGLAAAGERAEQLERRVVAHFDGVALLAEREGAERRLLKERAVDRRAVLRQQRRAVGAGATRSSGRGRPRNSSGAAVGNSRRRRTTDRTSPRGRRARSSRTSRRPHEPRRRPHGRTPPGRAVVIAVAAVQVGLAHAARDDADDQLVRARVGEIQVSMAKGTETLAHDRGCDLHDCVTHRGGSNDNRRGAPSCACMCSSTAAVGQQSTFRPFAF